MDRDRDDWGDDGGLGPLLDAYAVARLRPDPERTGVVRARVMAEARGRAVEVRHDTSARAAHLPRRRWRLPRLLRAPALAAGAWLLVGVLVAGGALAGSGPGGPLYGARLWLEEVTLPADPVARADAQLTRLDARVAEAAAAARQGDGAGVTAALEAYQLTAEQAFASAGVDPTRQERLAAALGTHVAVLDGLIGRVPARAADAIRAAVDRTEARIDQILATPPGTPVGPAANPKPGQPRAAPGSSGRPGPPKTPPGKPEATPTPAKTAAPGKNPPGKPEVPGKPKPAPSPKKAPPTPVP